MGKVLLIGAGGVAGVAAHKCCQNDSVFDAVCIASRTKSKCDAIKDAIKDAKYYTYGDNRAEQAAKAYWAKIKGEG